MSSLSKTLWMGNVKPFMTESFLFSFFANLEVYPCNIIVKNTGSKRGCAFLEFMNHEEAEQVLNNYNNKTINGINLIFNWVKTFEEKTQSTKIKKFTVS